MIVIYFILVIYVTKLFIIRHCETEGNINRLFQGHIDLPITELGYKQLESLGLRFKDIPFDRLYTSPLKRAVTTAKAVSGDRRIPIIEKGNLIELNGGDYEGKAYTQIGIEYPEFPDMWANRPWEFAPPSGEKMTDGYERIWNAVAEIARENEGKTVGVVSHGGVIRCLLCRLLKGNIEKLAQVPFGLNTAVSLIEFDNGTPRLVFFNDDSHLSDELKNKKADVPTGDVK